MSNTSSQTNFLSKTFQSTINNLKFYDFPCGNGSWNQSDNYREDSSLIQAEDLFELLNDKISPWGKDENNPVEILDIKKKLIFNKSNTSVNELLKKFKALKLSDKNISELENDVSLFLNLEELVLSANFIKSINSKMLPKKLKILELYSNELESLEFCKSKNIPFIQHLGVGANLITNIDLLSSSNLKLSLVSLDLGKNKLSNLSQTTKVISELVNLKNLILAGNPLSLLAVYRAYIIDSIQKLIVLDDIQITADERFSVRKMSNISESVKKLCKFKIEMRSINNIPIKERQENAPEEPVIKTDYYVKFWFPFKYYLTKIIENHEKPEDHEDMIYEEIDEEIMYLHTSDKLPRNSPEILLNMIEDLEIKNIERFCDFLDENLRISVVEENKYLYSPDNLPAKGPSRMESQNSKKRQQKSANKHAASNPKAKETVKKKKIDESKLIIFSKSTEILADFSINLSCFKSGEVIYDEILKSKIIDSKNESKIPENSKIVHEKETKVKKLSAKGEKKSDKNSSSKEGKSSIVNNESVNPIECHVVLNLLTLANAKATEMEMGSI